MSDKMSPKNSSYFFHTEVVKGLIKARGGLEMVAVKIRTTVRTLYRTIDNESRNGRTQRDLLKFLRKSPTEVGEFRTVHKAQVIKSKRNPSVRVRPSSSPGERGSSSLAASAQD